MLVARRQYVKDEMPQVNIDQDFHLTLRELMRFEKNRMDSFSITVVESSSVWTSMS